jgi:hypothetical protein
MRKLLESFLDSEVGINIEHARHVEPVMLVAIRDEYFTVIRNKNMNHYHIPFNSIVKMIANEDGVIVGGFLEHRQSFPLVIQVGHMVEYVPM